MAAITRKRSAKDSAFIWDSLLQASSNEPTHKKTAKLRRCRGHPPMEEANDPFDCSELAVPHTSVLIERQLDYAIDRWISLDARLVKKTETRGNNHHRRQEFEECVGDRSGHGCVGSINLGSAHTDDRTSKSLQAGNGSDSLFVDGTIVGDKRRQRLLPPDFDYSCRLKSHGLDPGKSSYTTSDCDQRTNENHEFNLAQPAPHHRPQVISLLDPTQRLDYETELQDVFRSMETAAELEKRYGLAGAENCLRHTLQVKKDIESGILKYSRMDAHSLGRLRLRDRHSFSTTVTTYHHKTHNDRVRLSPTKIRFEILRYSGNLKRGSGPDANRLEIDVDGSRTLLYLHRILTELSAACDGEGGSTLGSASYGCGKSYRHVPGGIFFIEDNFYTYGDAGEKAAEAIVDWLALPHSNHNPKQLKGNREITFILDEKPQKLTKIMQHSPRGQYLGLTSLNESSSVCKVIPMSQALLNDLPLRMGVRYFHKFLPSQLLLKQSTENVCSLGTESALFVTDIRVDARPDPIVQQQQAPKQELISMQMSVNINDIWTQLQRPIVCAACCFCLATVVTVHDELADASILLSPSINGGRPGIASAFQGIPLCSGCYRELHYHVAPRNVTSHDTNNSNSDHITPEKGHQGKEIGKQPSKMLQSRNHSFQVFPIRVFQEIVMQGSLQQFNSSAPF